MMDDKQLNQVNDQQQVSPQTSMILTALLVAALIGYYLPWLNNAAAGLSANAFDLAEWISLSPLTRISNPPLLAPFLLRAGLAPLAILFALNARRTAGWLRWLNAGVGVLLTITLCPPVEFIRAPGGMDDPNYRQLFALLLVTLIAVGAIALVPRFQQWARWLSGVGGLLLIITSIWGTTLAFAILNDVQLRLTTPLGLGLICLIIGVIGHQIAVWSISKT